MYHLRHVYQLLWGVSRKLHIPGNDPFLVDHLHGSKPERHGKAKDPALVTIQEVETYPTSLRGKNVI